jgi:hypothetical protein
LQIEDLKKPVGVALFLGMLVHGCGGSPLSVTDCHDQYGRGGTAPNILKVSCTPAGSDVTCEAIADNSASNYVYCPISGNVTAQTAWISSNPSVAVFDQSRPGFLRAVGRGIAVITADYQRLAGSPEALAFFITPGTNAERMANFGVGVFGPNMSPLSGAQIVVELARGPSQQCLTQNAQCPSHSMWLLSGSATVRASKDGFQPWTIALEVDPAKGGYSVHQQIALVEAPR